MKTLTKTIILLSIAASVTTFSCKKKETKIEDPITPTPIESPYSTFSTTIAVIDYTAPVNAATNSFTVNLSPTTTAIAYIVADGARIDSLPLTINRIDDIVPASVTSSTASPCDKDIWNSLSLNSKEFKLKKGANNVLEIYEDGVLVSSRPIVIKETHTQYDFNSGYSISSPLTNSYPCADGKRFVVEQ
ncbi:hypothetical protein [Aurantibacillus circumpalustris]|uniref:hypothetical protein n=1 Tax=Aurantibacillus circumpalustris TaxID=3036359 RepID=UPI00295AEE35|nr:hypothetical protein [Aurantibacillus circumpalustris]